MFGAIIYFRDHAGKGRRRSHTPEPWVVGMKLLDHFRRNDVLFDSAQGHACVAPFPQPPLHLKDVSTITMSHSMTANIFLHPHSPISAYLMGVDAEDIDQVLKSHMALPNVVTSPVGTIKESHIWNLALTSGSHACTKVCSEIASETGLSSWTPPRTTSCSKATLFYEAIRHNGAGTHFGSSG